MGALWGTVGAVLGAVVGGIEGVIGPGPFLPFMFQPAVELGSLGFVAGSGFAVVLTALDGRRTIGEVSAVRAALWGGVAGAAVPALYLLIQGGWAGFMASISNPQHSFLMASILSGLVPAALASGTVFLARPSSGELPAGAAPIDPALESPIEKLR